MTPEEYCIKLTYSTLVRQLPYPEHYPMRLTLCYGLEEIKNFRVTRKSSPPNASPGVVVKKKDGSNRIYIDYRRLNKLTVFDPHPRSNLDPRREDAGERDGRHGGLCRRSIDPHFNLGRRLEDFEVVV
ncbi:KRAB-A domain-containing protein [Plakobranchus ocellatus]|uniref:KRAB-A domain-containing protein n=1 Tax=Plakobranchus ocellatus TaxID=259542 RepID=A0AAV4C8X2_9GAST|nr:KRAB-A domain-containing protein [Plakobranchus ocellatus]